MRSSICRQLLGMLLFCAVLNQVNGFSNGAPTSCGCPDCVPPHSSGLKTGFDAIVARSPDDGSEWIAKRTYTCERHRAAAPLPGMLTLTILAVTITGSFTGCFFSANDGDLDGGSSFRAYGGTCPAGKGASFYQLPLPIVFACRYNCHHAQQRKHQDQSYLYMDGSSSW